MERLHQVISKTWSKMVKKVQKLIIEYIRNYSNTQKVLNDIILLIVKQVA